MLRALRIERGELVDGKEKKGTKPEASLTAPNFFGSTTPNFNPGGEFIFPPGFFVCSLVNTWLQPRAFTQEISSTISIGYTRLKPGANERMQMTFSILHVHLVFRCALCPLLCDVVQS